MTDIEKTLERLETKFDKKLEADTERDITLAKLTQIAEINSESLQTHIKRTDLLETKIDLVKAEIHKDIEPIKNHVTQLKGFGKGLKWMLVGVGLIGSIVTLVVKFLP